MTTTKTKSPCCSRCRKPTEKFGLCKKCKKKHLVRIQAGKKEQDNMTDAELDALIAQRMKKLPKWWNKEAGK